MPDPWSPDPGSHPPLASGAPVLDAPPTYGSRSIGPARRPAPAPPERRPPTARGWMIAVAVLSVLLVVALIALVLSRRTDDVATRPTTTPSTTAPGSPSTTEPGAGAPSPSTAPPTSAPSSALGLPQGPAPTAAEAQAAVDELIPFVEQQRGVAFTTRPSVVVVPDAEFGTKLAEVLQPGDAAVQRRAALLQAMTVLANGIDLVDARNQFLTNETVARYDPATKALLVRGLPITRYTQAQLVTELSRALDDQVAPITRPQYATDPTELAFTFDALIDGDAARIRAAWLASLPADGQAEYAALVEQVHAASRPQGANHVILDQLDGAATAGRPFVEQLLLQAPDRFASALTAPPAASSQVLHPDRYLAGEEPEAVDEPEAGGAVIDRGVFGEELTALVLADSIAPADAAEAADGWRGDSYVLWEGGGAGTCLTIRYRLRDDAELVELAQAFTAWARTRGGVQIQEGRGRGSLLEVTSCAGAAAGRSPL